MSRVTASGLSMPMSASPIPTPKWTCWKEPWVGGRPGSAALRTPTSAVPEGTAAEVFAPTISKEFPSKPLQHKAFQVFALRKTEQHRMIRSRTHTRFDARFDARIHRRACDDFLEQVGRDPA